MAKEYFITKLTFKATEKLIDHVCVYEYDEQNLSTPETQQRDWLVNRVQEGFQFSILSPSSKNQEKWSRGNQFTYENGYFKWWQQLPENNTKRKTFVSYYHFDDQEYREKFENLFRDLIVSKSVQKDDINSDNSDEYIKQLIQKDYLQDTTVLVVLVGPNTKHRKHVDWEISGAISSRVGGHSGLVGILLPNHPDFGKGNGFNPQNLPERLAANVESGYAKVYDWTEDRCFLQLIINEAFNSKGDTDKIKNKSIPQMQEDTNL